MGGDKHVINSQSFPFPPLASWDNIAEKTHLISQMLSEASPSCPCNFTYRYLWYWSK